MKYFLTIGERNREVELTERMGEMCATIDGREVPFSYTEVDQLGQIALILDGNSYAVSIEGDEASASVTVAGRHFQVELENERERAARVAEQGSSKSGGTVKSSMPGVVVDILVAVGDAVEAGQSLLILEAMKMQNEIKAPAAGVVQKLHVSVGEAVSNGAQLIALKGE